MHDLQSGSDQSCGGKLYYGSVRIVRKTFGISQVLLHHRFHLLPSWHCYRRFKQELDNQQPRRKRRGTVLNVSHCVFYKVVAVGFNTLCYDAERSSKLYIRV